LNKHATGRCFPSPFQGRRRSCFLGSGGCPSLLGGLRQIESIGLSFNLRDTAAEKIGDVVDGASTGKSAIQVE
jgi:hypothetical protein